MKKWIPLVSIVVVAGNFLAGCRPAPCSGGDKSLDDRPLVGVLRDVGSPAGSSMCRFSSEDDAPDVQRRYELLDLKPGTTVIAWRDHLRARGWREVTPAAIARANDKVAHAKDDAASGTVEHFFRKEGADHAVRLIVSHRLKHGWSTLVATACAKRNGAPPSSVCNY